MAIVSKNDLNTYTNNYEAGTDVDALKDSILEAAQQVIEAYLGYKLDKGPRRGIFSGVGSDRLYLPDYNIISVDCIVVRNARPEQREPYPFIDTIDCGPAYIQERFGVPVFIEGRSNIIVEYYAGWTSNNLPQLIKMTILRIASLMLTEANGNIGLTGRNYIDNSKTFLNYTNYDKYLRPIDLYKGVRN